MTQLKPTVSFAWGFHGQDQHFQMQTEYLRTKAPPGSTSAGPRPGGQGPALSSSGSPPSPRSQDPRAEQPGTSRNRHPQNKGQDFVFKLPDF